MRIVLQQAKAQTIFDDAGIYMQAQLPKIFDQTPLAQAIRCALTHMSKVQAYSDIRLLGHNTLYL